MQREVAVRDAECGMSEWRRVIDRELPAMREVTMRGVVRRCVRVLGRDGRDGRDDLFEAVIAPELVIDLDVLVRDAQRGEVIIARVVVIVVVIVAARMLVVMRVIALVLAAFAATELDDRAVGRVRVLVVMRREVEVGQHLDAQQPQRGCHHRNCAATPS